MTETLVAGPAAPPAALPADAPPRATRREWLGLAVLALPTLLSAMDFSVLFLALPRLSADLRPSGSQLLWITDIYGFMVAGFLVTMGALGNRIGRRRLLTAGAAAFGLASAAAAYSASPPMLIAARALLGIAGATLMPSTLGLISAMFRHPGQRTSAVSLWAACLLAGTAIGPVAGGALLQFFWWGSVFLIGLPVMAVLMIAAPLLLPEHRDPAGGRLDLVSVALSLAAVLPAVYGLKTLVRSGLTGPAVLTLAAGLACGALFGRRQRSAASPLLDLRLFRYRAFTAAVGILLAAGAVSGGIGFLFAQYLQLVAGLSPLRAGLWSLPDTAAMIACSLLCPLAARRIQPGYVIGGGLAISAAGFWLLTQVHAGPGPAVAVAGVVIVFTGVTPAWVLGTDLIIASVPPEAGGSASSVSETASELGVALGVAVLGSIAAAANRVQVARAVPARQAFTDGLGTAAAASVAVAAALALLDVILLRRPHSTPDPSR
jgi:MFS transporter, DHA2 family, multidrug resistance protein